MFIDMIENLSHIVLEGMSIAQIRMGAQEKWSRRTVIVGRQMKNPGSGLTVPWKFKDDILTGDTGAKVTGSIGRSAVFVRRLLGARVFVDVVGLIRGLFRGLFRGLNLRWFLFGFVGLSRRYLFRRRALFNTFMEA